jgi:hypothetical protein
MNASRQSACWGVCGRKESFFASEKFLNIPCGVQDADDIDAAGAWHVEQKVGAESLHRDAPQSTSLAIPES